MTQQSKPQTTNHTGHDITVIQGDEVVAILHPGESWSNDCDSWCKLYHHDWGIILLTVLALLVFTVVVTKRD